MTATPALPRDVNKALEDMMARITRMMDLYNRETQALENFDMSGFSALQSEKLDAAGDYESAARQILLRRGEMQSASAVLKENLQTMQREFSRLCARNLEALERARRSSQRLANVMIEKACKSLQHHIPVSYTESGTAHNRRAGLSIGINQSA